MRDQVIQGIRSHVSLGILMALCFGIAGTMTQTSAQTGQQTGDRNPEANSKRTATPLRESSAALTLLNARDRELLEDLDRAWCSGSSEEVVKLFTCPTRPSYFELLGRVRSSQMDGDCVRESQILSKEVANPYCALLLETKFSYPRDSNHKEPASVTTHELLIYRDKSIDGERASKLEPIYLIETDLASLLHVTGRLSDGSGPYSGLSISRSTAFSCKACNYRLSLPGKGSWMILARPSADSGLLESVELLNLEMDLGLELSIVPVHRTGLDTKQRSERLLGFLDEGVKVLESCSGKISSGSKRKKTDLFGLMGWTQTVLLRDTQMGRRFYKLFGLNGASLDYMVSVHGAAGQLDTDGLQKKEQLASLDHCFQLLDPDRKDDEAFEIIHSLHGGAGKFVGRHYIVKKLGLDLTGPDGWNRFKQVGNARFIGGFDCAKSGSVIYLSGIERPGGNWDKKTMAAWAVNWINQQKKRHGAFHNGRMNKVTVAGEDGFEFDFDYPIDTDQESERARGFLAMFARNSTLVVVMAVAHPVKMQKQIMASLEKSLGSLRFE